ncbi:MAG: hypothetical protein O3C28_00580 [Proteobacteria bacterium]|nr:hypothetical protein [Pseudomonadota bacterium]
MTGSKLDAIKLRKICLRIVVIALACSGMQTQAAIKCWKNHEGVRECGNAVPPEFAQQGHQEVSEGGAKVSHTKKAKSIEELEAERRAKQEELAAQERSREQAVVDRVLLDTFSSEDDMILTRDGQIAHLESQVKLTEGHIEKLQASLEELVKEAADHERRGKAPPEKLVKQIGSLRDQLKDNKTFIETKKLEQTHIAEKFAADIERFRELKGLKN